MLFRKKPLVFICSPYRGDVEKNAEKARRYCRFVYEQADRTSTPIPFAPHLLFTQFLDESIDAERDAGLAMGVEMLALCDEIWVFGVPTLGMRYEMSAARIMGKRIRRFTENCVEVNVDE